MTKEELDIVKQLSILGKRIKALPEIYEDPENELNSQVFLHINALERIVFAREGLRAYTKVAAGEIIKKLEADLPPKWLKDIQKSAKIGEKSRLKARKKSVPKKRKWNKKDTAEVKHLQKHGAPIPQSFKSQLTLKGAKQLQQMRQTGNPHKK